MRRREFIAGLGAAAWPIAARAQSERVRRIGLFVLSDENDPLAKTEVSTFTQALASLGWTDGRNLRMDLRWHGDGGDINRIRALAQELVGLLPDIILANSRRPSPSSGRRGRSRSSLHPWASPSLAASSLNSTSRAGTSPALPSSNPRWGQMA
jgi:putative ABC transport system substrate-binding protein